MIPKRAPRVDANQAEIMCALRRAGCSVQSLGRIGDGCPDLLVGRAGANWLLELKSGRNDGLRATQALWRQSWNGQVALVRSADEALSAVGLAKPAKAA